MCVCEASNKELFQWMDSWACAIEELNFDGKDSDDPQVREAIGHLQTIEEEIERRGL